MSKILPKNINREKAKKLIEILGEEKIKAVYELIEDEKVSFSALYKILNDRNIVKDYKTTGKSIQTISTERGVSRMTVYRLLGKAIFQN